MNKSEKRHDLKMPDLNLVLLAGRLTRDPELRYTPQGTAVCKFGLAVSRNYKSRDGETKEDTTYVNVEAWEKQAEWIGEHVKKGYPVIVEGSLKSDEWEDRSTGQKRTTILVRARRVQQLTWEGFNSDTRLPSQADVPAHDGDQEDDIPF